MPCFRRSGPREQVRAGTGWWQLVQAAGAGWYWLAQASSGNRGANVGVLEPLTCTLRPLCNDSTVQLFCSVIQYCCCVTIVVYCADFFNPVETEAVGKSPAGACARGSTCHPRASCGALVQFKDADIYGIDVVPSL